MSVRPFVPELRSVSEDDFEADTKREAKEYAHKQAQEHERASILAENKRRKEQGLRALPVPRRPKERKKKILGYDSDTSEEKLDETEEDKDVPDTSSRKRKRRDDDEQTGKELELQYEGRKLLNPLDQQGL
jgi:hypothetical protein